MRGLGLLKYAVGQVGVQECCAYAQVKVGGSKWGGSRGTWG